MTTVETLSAIIIISRIASILKGEWIEPSTKLPRAEEDMAVGYIQDTVTLIGGDGYPTEMMEYNITTGSFTISSITLTTSVYGRSQYWSQTHNIVYIIDYQGQSINTYDLSSKTFTQNWETIPINVDQYGCMASSNDALYIVGGKAKNGKTLNSIQILYITSGIWTTETNMMEERKRHSCIVSSSSDELYAIGGWSANTIEYASVINIEQNTWSYTIGNLRVGLSGVRSVSYDKYIYIIGGEENTIESIDEIHIVDTTTHSVTISDERLVYTLAYTTPIIVGSTLYAFAGWITGDDEINRFQYYTFANTDTTYKPTISEPTTSKSTTSRSTTPEPATSEPTTAEPTKDEPTTSIPTTAEPTTAELTTAKPIASVPRTENTIASSTDVSMANTPAILASDDKDRTTEPLRVIDNIDIALALCGVFLFCVILFGATYLYKRKQVENELNEVNDQIDHQISKEVKANNIIGVCDDQISFDVDDNVNAVNNEVISWLESINLLQYYELFSAAKFDSMEMILAIDDKAILRKIGVIDIGHQTLLFQAIKQIKATNKGSINAMRGGQSEGKIVAQSPILRFTQSSTDGEELFRSVSDDGALETTTGDCTKGEESQESVIVEFNEHDEGANIRIQNDD